MADIVRKIKICTDKQNDQITWSQADIAVNSNNVLLNDNTISETIFGYNKNTSLNVLLASILDRLSALENPESEEEEESPEEPADQ